MPRFAGRVVKVLLETCTFRCLSFDGDICGQATEGYHTSHPQTPVRLAG